MATFDATTPQLKVVKNFVDGFLSRDIKSVRSVIAKNYVFNTLPKTAEAPNEMKETGAERHGMILAALTKIEPNIHEVIEAPGKVVIHATLTCCIGDTKVDYDTLCIFSFTEEDGELKILEVKNFADPQKAGALHTAVDQAQGKGGLVA